MLNRLIFGLILVKVTAAAARALTVAAHNAAARELLAARVAANCDTARAACDAYGLDYTCCPTS